MTTKTEDYTNNFDHNENGGPNCDVRAVSQFCNVFIKFGLCLNAKRTIRTKMRYRKDWINV